jgi:hypothetical protein
MTLDRGAGAGNGAACHEYARAGELPVVNFLQSRSIGIVNGHAEKHRRLIVQRSAHRKHREFTTLPVLGNCRLFGNRTVGGLAPMTPESRAQTVSPRVVIVDGDVDGAREYRQTTPSEYPRLDFIRLAYETAWSYLGCSLCRGIDASIVQTRLTSASPRWTICKTCTHGRDDSR